MSKLDQYVHPITREAAIEVASNIRDDDRRELEEGHGLTPYEYLVDYEAKKGTCVWFEVPNGKTAGMAGVDNGIIWMVCTPAIHEYPITFAREAKRFVESRTEPLLWNIVDKRNRVHLKLLKFLGFKFLREISHGPNNLSFIEFCRVLRK